MQRMFNDVSLKVTSKNDLYAAAKLNSTKLSIVDCNPLDRERMTMLLDLDGTPDDITKTVASMQKMAGVKAAHKIESDAKGARVFVVLDKPGVCRASSGAAVMCLDCPYNSTEVPARWRFITRRTSDVGDIIARLGGEGIEARVEDISPLDKNVTLTQKERGIIAVAVENGYFDFPRKITLEGLSQLVGVEVEALSKILRSVE